MISTVLNSWKEIAAYLHSGVRTAQRWEDELGLPIHRPHNKRGPAIAFTNELDQWLRRRSSGSELNPEGIALAVTAGHDVGVKGLPIQPHPATPVLKDSVLNSWKEIAAYLNCSPQTVRQWRNKFGLPVHQPNGRRGPVLAFMQELDEWLRRRSSQRTANAADLAATALLDDVYPELAKELEGFRRRLAVHVARLNGTAPGLMERIRDLTSELSRTMDDDENPENPEKRYDSSVPEREKTGQGAFGPTDETRDDQTIAGFGRTHSVPAVAAGTEDGAMFSGRRYIRRNTLANGSQFLRVGLNFAFTMIHCTKQIGPTKRRHAAIEAVWKTYRAIVRLSAWLPLDTAVDAESKDRLEKLGLALQELGGNDEINVPGTAYYSQNPDCG